MVLGVAGTVMKSATYTRRIKNSREIVGVSTVTFGSKNEPTPMMPANTIAARLTKSLDHVDWPAGQPLARPPSDKMT
jgi:hypothetical protein